MAVTATQIRNLLNNPRGLIQGTITEYITIRTNQVTKVARGSNYAVATANVVTDDLKDDAIKMLVCVDCLAVLVDTIPTIYPPKEQGTQDIRFSKQLKHFEDRANEALELVAEKAGSAFVVDKTRSRLEYDYTESDPNRETRTEYYRSLNRYGDF